MKRRSSDGDGEEEREGGKEGEKRLTFRSLPVTLAVTSFLIGATLKHHIIPFL
jgi:hypothetical protein